MKRIAILIFALFGCGILTAQSSSWTLMQLSFPEELNTVSGTPGSSICIGGEFGDIRRADTSLNFISTLPANNEGIADILFNPWGDGWAVGEDGLIFKSSDSGQTWTQLSSGVSNSLESICFVNQDTAFIAGRDGVILRSTDGGTSWSLLISGTTERLEAVSFPTSTHGFVAGRNGVFLETQDAGDNWTSISLGPDDNKDVLFTSSTLGFVAGGNGLMRTSDGGATWNTVLSSNIVELEDLDFRNNSGVAVGEDGNIYSSDDDGVTWTLDTMFMAMMSLEFNDVAFIDSLGIVAVGEAGYIAHQFVSGGSNISISERENIETRVFPNPADKHLQFELPIGQALDGIILVNSQGREIRINNISQGSIDLSQVPNGIYMILFTEKEALLPYTTKILVSH